MLIRPAVFALNYRQVTVRQRGRRKETSADRTAPRVRLWAADPHLGHSNAIISEIAHMIIKISRGLGLGPRL